MILCILDLLILIWDIVIIVHDFVTKTVGCGTLSLMAVALWLLVTIILNLKNDIENRVKRRRIKISKLCDRKCEDCKFDHKCSDKVEVTEYRYGGKIE